MKFENNDDVILRKGDYDYKTTEPKFQGSGNFEFFPDASEYGTDQGYESYLDSPELKKNSTNLDKECHRGHETHCSRPNLDDTHKINPDTDFRNSNVPSPPKSNGEINRLKSWNLFFVFFGWY